MPEQSCSIPRGLKINKNSAEGEVFLVDFPSYRTKDQARVMTRVKAVYRSWAIPCVGKQVYGQRHRLEWLGKIEEPGVRRRAEFYYAELGASRSVRLVVLCEVVLERKQPTVLTRVGPIP